MKIPHNRASNCPCRACRNRRNVKHAQREKAAALVRSQNKELELLYAEAHEIQRRLKSVRVQLRKRYNELTHIHRTRIRLMEAKPVKLLKTELAIHNRKVLLASYNLAYEKQLHIVRHGGEVGDLLEYVV